MQPVRQVSLLAITAGLIGAVSIVGCGSEKPREKPEARSESSEGKTTSGTSSETKTASTTSGGREQLASTGWGSLKGQVTYDGDPPPRQDLKPQMEQQQDKSHCLKGPTLDPTWIVGADKGVQNVVVWLRAPKGKYFKIPDNEKHRSDTVKIDQPFCEFEPHVVVLYPSYYDGEAKKQVKTGQTFKVVNSAPIAHNTDWVPADRLVNQGNNVILKAHSGEQPISFKACKDTAVGGEQLIDFKCDIHKWMKAFARVYDHPFVAVTDERGNYQIANAPAGAEVELVYWHEDLGAPKVLKTITLKEGENGPENFTVKK